MCAIHMVKLTISGPNRSGEMTTYATPAEVTALMDRFGHALTVRTVTNGDYTSVRVGCPTQRGEGGAFRLHSLACDARIPVVCDQPTEDDLSYAESRGFMVRPIG